MFCNLKTFNSYHLLSNKKQLEKWLRLKLIFLYKTVRNIFCYLSTVHISQNVQNQIHNLQIRVEQFTDLTKKLKNTSQLELHFSYLTTLKSLKHESCLSLDTCHKYVVQVSEPTPTIYWYAKKNQINLFKYASTKYNPIKAMFLYLKRNV